MSPASYDSVAGNLSSSANEPPSICSLEKSHHSRFALNTSFATTTDIDHEHSCHQPQPLLSSITATAGMDMSPSKTPGHGQNIWTEEQRLVLHLLHRFHFSPQSRASIFNHIFDDELRRCGVAEGLSVNTLQSQYGERHRDGRTHLWKNVLGNPKDAAEQTKQEGYEERIMTAATVVGANVLPPVMTSTGDKKQEDDDNDEGDTNEEEKKEGSNPVQQSRQKASQLFMLHNNEIDWISGNQPTAVDLTNAIPKTSPVYQFGGQVHCVIFEDVGDTDCMICDPTFCTQCYPGANANQTSKTNGHAFVHSCDTTKTGDNEFVFTPTSGGKPHRTAPAVNWPRPMYFRTGQGVGEDGSLICNARVCQSVDCDICQGRESDGQLQ